MVKRFKNHLFFKSLDLLYKSDQRKIWLIVLVQIFLSFIDLVAVASIGILGAISIRGIQSKMPGDRVSKVLEIFGLSQLSFMTQVIVIGCIAGIIFAGRSVISIYFSRRILYFMSIRSARISQSLINELLDRSYIALKSKSSQELLYAVTSGVSTVLVQILGTGIILISDFSLLIVLGGGILLLDPFMALMTFIIFGLIGLLLHQVSSKKISRLSRESVQYGIDINNRFVQVIGAFREIIVRDRRQYFAENIGELRLKSAWIDAELNFMPNIGKYVIEAAGIIAGLVLAGIEFYRADAAHAVATLSVFLAAGSRITPAALRVQQSLLKIRSNEGAANKTLNLIEEFDLQINQINETADGSSGFNINHQGFNPSINLSNIGFTYDSNESHFSVTDLNLRIEPGEFVAIVGPSGAGKTTLVDLILGIITPDSGIITISGHSPSEAIKKFPGAIAYVPQDVAIFTGSLRENIAIGFDSDAVPEGEISRAIEISRLGDLRSTQSDSSMIQIGESGAFISGGQRQRIGIARAVLTHPQLLLLDEATSSLDGATESSITEAIQGLRGQVTTVVVAHRLSTVMSADKVVYMDSGKILCVGKFDEVRRKIGDFDSQAKLMGL